MPATPALTGIKTTGMTMTRWNLSRRHWLGGSLALAATTPFSSAVQAQPGGGTGRLVQMLDMSAEQQELSRDYATGVRLAWAGDAERARQGSRPGLQTLNVDGSEASVREAVAQLAADPSVVGLLGTVGDRLAVRVHQEARRIGWAVPHIAPWMADTRHDQDSGLACLFASRQVQMQQAMTAVRGMGMDEMCVLYGSPAEQALYDSQLEAAAKSAGLRTRRLTTEAGSSARAMAAKLPPTSGIVLCMGTSAELAQLTQGMAERRDRRFVLGLGDVDAPSLQQLMPGKGVPVILTQVVPNPQRGNQPVVVEFRQRLKALFDEAPSPISLAGYLAGQYALDLLQATGGRAGREALTAELVRRNSRDLKGWRVDFRGEDRRGSRYVTQTLLASDGRLIG